MHLMDRYYQSPGRGWSARKAPPPPLVNLVRSGVVKAGRALDIGCGEGRASIYLAKRGFEVTGFDLSPRAIETARAKAEAAGLAIDFFVEDATNLAQFAAGFDFAYDWGMLDLFTPQREARERYLDGVRHALNVGGRFAIFCFNPMSFGLQGPGVETRTTERGDTLNFSRFDEIEAMLDARFTMISAKRIVSEVIDRKPALGNWFVVEKR